MDEDKYVDESWKESVADEKKQLSEQEGKSVSQEKELGGEKQVNDDAVPSPEDKQKSEQVQDDSHEETPEVNFINYITSLSMQTMIFLGEIPNPLTNEVEESLSQAKFIIDTLDLLREKTQGNLTKQEDDLINAAIYELQMKYVEHSQKKHPKED